MSQQSNAEIEQTDAMLALVVECPQESEDEDEQGE